MQAAQQLWMQCGASLSGACLNAIVFVGGALSLRDINLLTPNVNYSGRTTPPTSKVAFYIFIQQI
jgi:hypothetical protein